MKAILPCCAVLALILIAGGCRGPTAEDRDNRRLLDEILTAITIKNPRLLEDASRRADARHALNQLTVEDYQQVAAFIEKARQGDWSAAEINGYAFRKKRPFVRGGQ